MPAFAIRNPTCTGKISRRKPLALDEFLFLRKHTTLPIKIPLPGPYLLTRAMWVKEATRAVYPAKEDLAEDVVSILREEVANLCKAGADFIQFDEPVLTELVFTQGQTRTFMCAALCRPERSNGRAGIRFALAQSCPGRHGTDTDRCAYLSGKLERQRPYPVKRLVPPFGFVFGTVECKTTRSGIRYSGAGELSALLSSEKIRETKELGLGVVNPRTRKRNRSRLF